MIKPINLLTIASVLIISLAAVPTLQAAEHNTPSNQGSMMEDGSMGMMKMMAQMAPMMEQCTKLMASMTDNMKTSTDQ